MLKVGILGSGTGTNFSAILDSIQNGSLPNVKIEIVISDVADAKILSKAENAGLNSKYIAVTNFKTKLEGEPEQNYIDTLQNANVDYVVLAGFMRILKPKFLAAFKNKIINIHPALLPAFPGVHSWEQALNYGAKFSGCTVHFVDEGTDTGPIIAQAVVPILNDDTPATLHQRIQIEEHKLLPYVLRLLAEQRIKIEGRRTFIL